MKYFDYSEFDSKDEPGSGEKYMDSNLLEILDTIREVIGRPMKVNSGYRSEAHNKKVGGVKNSQHRLGKAADIHIKSQEEADEIADIALTLGIGGIGRYNSFIHLDTGKRRDWDNRS